MMHLRIFYFDLKVLPLKTYRHNAPGDGDQFLGLYEMFRWYFIGAAQLAEIVPISAFLKLPVLPYKIIYYLYVVQPLPHCAPASTIELSILARPIAQQS